MCVPGRADCSLDGRGSRNELRECDPVAAPVPQPLYEQLQARAARRQRIVADEVLDVLTVALPATDALPDDLEQAIAQLVFWMMQLCSRPVGARWRVMALSASAS